jgi:hypothetical protein
MPAFAVNTLVKKALGRPGIDHPHLETIFARGIDPSQRPRPCRAATGVAIARQCGNTPTPRIGSSWRPLSRPSSIDPATCCSSGSALWTILEHEEMHQETFGYICHHVHHELKRRPAGYTSSAASPSTPDLSRRVAVPAGAATLGTDLRTALFAG